MVKRSTGRPRATTHAEIAAVSIELFRLQGFGPTSLNEIAAAVGISRTALFGYFRTKADIVWHFYDQISTVFIDELHRRPVTETFPNAIRAALETSMSAPENVEILGTAWQIVESHGELSAAAAQHDDRGVDAIVRAVTLRTNLSASDLTPHLIGVAFSAVTTDAARYWFAHRVDRPLAEFVSEAVAPVLDGYTAALGAAAR